jgi:hypothetical protein
MAEELQIKGTQDQVKIRSPWAAALLPIITLGIYHIVWWYKINRELRDYGRAKGVDLGQNPTNSLLAVFPGGLIIVPALITYWRGGKRIQEAQRMSGQEPLIGWLAIVLYIVLALGLWAYFQDSLNKVWRAQGEAAPDAAELGSGAAAAGAAAPGAGAAGSEAGTAGSQAGASTPPDSPADAPPAAERPDSPGPGPSPPAPGS